MDTRRLQVSSSLKLYPQLSLYSGLQPYLQTKIELSSIRIMAQLRLLNIYNTRIIIKGKSYQLSAEQSCKCVERRPISDDYHIFINCNSFEEIRKKYISPSNNKICIRESWLKLVSEKTPSSIRRIVNFVTKILESFF